MMPRLAAVVILLICGMATDLYSSVQYNGEIFRIKVENENGGRVQVSDDGGGSYSTVGHVVRRAASLHKAFPAAAYTPCNSVAATAVHGIRIRAGSPDDPPVTFSLVPSEFSAIPKGYGGHIPYGSGIYTDIPTGKAIFRNFAPLVGSLVKIERNGALVDLPEKWQPGDGDIIVIISYLPKPYLRELVFENRAGGSVVAKYDDGREERVATVLRAVKGVGRFDGASYTGIGLINTNHGGVITISTSPITTSKLLEGIGKERRGGFQIQPSEHAKTQPPMPQAMVIGPVDGAAPLEGRAPLFSGYIGLFYDPSEPKNSLKAEVSIRGGPWLPMPEAIGKQDDALEKIGVTGIRLLFPLVSH